jgi:hypothetical protein
MELYEKLCFRLFKYHHMLQMVREYKGNSSSPNWSSFESISKALWSVVFGDVRMGKAFDVFRLL